MAALPPSVTDALFEFQLEVLLKKSLHMNVHIAGRTAGSNGDIRNTLACTRVQSLGGMRECIRVAKLTSS
jgi:hypothetical protein